MIEFRSKEANSFVEEQCLSYVGWSEEAAEDIGKRLNIYSLPTTDYLFVAYLSFLPEAQTV
jgi:hypothetical protein